MRFTETELKGAFFVEPELFEDERGYFTTTFCRKEFEEHGLNPDLVQAHISYNRRRGTLRGMHYQEPPCAQAKLVRCTRGSIFDVIVDIRPGSPSYARWVGAELVDRSPRMLYVPEGFAHGFQTLADDTEVVYNVSTYYAPELARGFRWDDPVFGIVWPPTDERIIIGRDRTYPDFPSR